MITTTTDHCPYLLPAIALATDKAESEIIQIFRQRLQAHDAGRMETRLLSAIYRTADLTGYSDAYVAKILVDHGFQAPRFAFPQEFLDYADKVAARAAEEPVYRKAPPAFARLFAFWRERGDTVWQGPAFPFSMPSLAGFCEA